MVIVFLRASDVEIFLQIGPGIFGNEDEALMALFL